MARPVRRACRHARRGCPYLAALGRSSCCHECHDCRGGGEHGTWCECLGATTSLGPPEVALDTGQASTRTGSRSRLEPSQSREVRVILTFGFNGRCGRALMRHWFRDGHTPKYPVEDVRPFCGMDIRGGPPGTNIRTQQRILESSPGLLCMLLPLVLGRLLLDDVVILACNVGRHRSVAVAEIARRTFHLIGDNRVIHIMHLELANIESTDWEHLLRLRSL